MNRPASQTTASHVTRELRGAARPDKAEFYPKFFKAEAGGYGEGDRFLGVVVPDQRKIAKQHAHLPREELLKLLESPWHECRLTALFILVHQFDKAFDGKRADPVMANELVHFYLSHLAVVNNWDLVDASAPKVLGRWLLRFPEQRDILDRLAVRPAWWERRVAVLATLPLIHAQQYDEIVSLAERLLTDSHDLMHKAIGWMLREVGKQDLRVLKSFLTMYATRMPRTMLRYAIEKLAEKERQHWLSR